MTDFGINLVIFLTVTQKNSFLLITHKDVLIEVPLTFGGYVGSGSNSKQNNTVNNLVQRKQSAQ